MNRRMFVKASTGAALGGLFFAESACTPGEESSETGETESSSAAMQSNQRSLARIGVQLYTVRGLMEEDMAGTLERVRGAGYDEVEFAGYFDHTPADIKTMLDADGLTAPSAHIALDLLRNDLPAQIEIAHALGHEYIVCPWLEPEERSVEAFHGHAELFNTVGEQCKAAGIQFCYHNHDFEFEEVDGKPLYDMLLAETDPELVKMELDLYWIAVGGYDPLTYFERYPGRFPLCHVKDRDASGNMVSVGKGTIDFAAIFAASEQAGLKHYFVEHDNPDDPIQSITDSAAYLRALRF